MYCYNASGYSVFHCFSLWGELRMFFFLLFFLFIHYLCNHSALDYQQLKKYNRMKNKKRSSIDELLSALFFCYFHYFVHSLFSRFSKPFYIVSAGVSHLIYSLCLNVFKILQYILFHPANNARQFYQRYLSTVIAWILCGLHTFWTTFIHNLEGNSACSWVLQKRVKEGKVKINSTRSVNTGWFHNAPNPLLIWLLKR